MHFTVKEKSKRRGQRNLNVRLLVGEELAIEYIGGSLPIATLFSYLGLLILRQGGGKSFVDF